MCVWDATTMVTMWIEAVVNQLLLLLLLLLLLADK